MELKVNGKELQIKFNFASLNLWEEKIVDSNGDKQTDREMFDALFTGLVQKAPRMLVNIYNGGLAYLGKDKPTYAEVFDAVSNTFSEEGIDKVAQNLMTELTANGFFAGSMKLWIDSIKKQINGYEKYFKDNKPKKTDSKEVKEKYEAFNAQYQMLKEQSEPMLEEYEKMLKATGNTL